ncbi:glycosyltransferase family 2 protein [Acetobacter oeni]|uniref:Glycosyl transferase n=1 Tax=Acetobacter oeni TaxID=304077 RepID=A0A511XLW6_9PROT|nr:glycosyltransferase family A protein [Acetobacter oeni]MBB3882941.1 glycosyltransferase involved in cell wall biosynthesis [Acetobacter oeni]NHO19023.1 glycosyltransferase [Acetobacter oeni]GBR09317.1 glycosyltransferase [Acetobacter oeni LMG 21952]GEN63937.1 glycosyl transferase [Acetobacter oeni]
MRFSLVIPTLNRPDSLEIFLDGLCQQSFTDLEVIIVDQSGSNLYDNVIGEYASRLPLLHIRSDIRQCRYACAVGAAQASGDIIAFPDDDCLYLPDTLSHVDEAFRKNPDLGFLTGSVINCEGHKTRMGRWLQKSTKLNQKNIWIGLIEFNMFIRRDLYNAVGGFDTAMGPGCRFVAAEGQDLGLRLLRSGANGYFDADLLVMHPDKSDEVGRSRARSYGRGMGYALRKNEAPLSLVMIFFIRPLGGLVLNQFRRRSDYGAYYLRVLAGRVEGYFSKAASEAASEKTHHTVVR